MKLIYRKICVIDGSDILLSIKKKLEWGDHFPDKEHTTTNKDHILP